MSGIIHIQQQPGVLRFALIGLGLAVAGVVVAQLLGVFDSAPEPQATAVPAVSTPRAAAPSGVAGAQFPSVRFKLLAVSPSAQGAGSAQLEVEGRQGQFSVGQEAFPGVVLRRVSGDHVVLAYGELSRIVLLSPASAAAPAPAGDEDMSQRNKDVDVRRLTFARFQSADSFLREVELAPHPRGGFEVRAVVPESLYDKAGLRVGDVIYSLDTDNSSKIDDRSLEAVMGQTHYELDVYRNGQLVPLRYRLPTSDPADLNTPAPVPLEEGSSR